MPIPLVVTKRYEGQRSHHGDSSLLKPTGIQIVTKSLPGRTNREHRKFIGVKTISLSTNYSFYCLESCQYIRICITSYREDCLMCCPTNEVIESDTKQNLAFGGLHEDNLWDILQVTAPTNVKTAHQTSLLHNIESNPDRLRLLPPTHGQRSQQQSEQITLQTVLINASKFLKATHHTEKKEN